MLKDCKLGFKSENILWSINEFSLRTFPFFLFLYSAIFPALLLPRETGIFGACFVRLPAVENVSTSPIVAVAETSPTLFSNDSLNNLNSNQGVLDLISF